MIVVEVGAFEGQNFSIPFAKDSEGTTVYAIEPIPEFANRIRRYNLRNLIVETVAISEINSSIVDLYVCQEPRNSSLLPARCQGEWLSSQDSFSIYKTLQVPTRTLESFIVEHVIVDIDILKIDVQGSELSVLKSLGNRLNYSRRIIVNFQNHNLYHDDHYRSSLIDYVTSHGFYLNQLSEPHLLPLQEELEFIRVNRFHIYNVAEHEQVDVPHVGTIQAPKHDHVAHLLEQGNFEGAEQAFVWLYLQPGDTFFDCGSHVGLFSAIAAKKLKNDINIVGFEPHPTCFDLYQKNLLALGCHTFQAFNQGLSDVPGKAVFHQGEDGMSAFSTFSQPASNQLQGASSHWVELVTLDDIVSSLNLSVIQLAKLDVEGWEHLVLKGGSSAIAAKKFPVWMIEFTENNALSAGSSTQKLRALIESMGYTLCRFDLNRFCLIPEEPKPYYTYDNLFAVLDLDAVNQRLQSAETQYRYIAADLIARWDTAVNSERFRYAELSLKGRIAESQNTRHLLQQAQQSLEAETERNRLLTDELTEKKRIVTYLFNHTKEQELLSSRLLHEAYLNTQRLNAELYHREGEKANLQGLNHQLSNQNQELSGTINALQSLVNHLEKELDYRSTGKAALRKLIKVLLSKLGIYQFVYQNHRIFVPLANLVLRDRWKPATIYNPVQEPETSIDKESTNLTQSDIQEGTNSEPQLYPETKTISLDLNRMEVEGFIALRAVNNTVSSLDYDHLKTILTDPQNILWIKPHNTHLPLLEVFAKASNSVTCVECSWSDSTPQFSSLEVLSKRFDQWLAQDMSGNLLRYDTIFIPESIPDSYFNLLKNRLSSRSKLVVVPTFASDE